MEEVVRFIKDLGFPIFVAVYMMIFMRKSLVNLAASNERAFEKFAESSANALAEVQKTNDEIVKILRRSVGA